MTPALSGLSFSLSDETITITDLTDYDSPIRSDVAVFLEAWKMDSTSDETALSVSNSEPETVTSWTIDATIDGWYKVKQYIVEEYFNITAYAADDVVYYPSTETLYKALQSTTGNLPTNPTYWEEVALEDSDIDGNNVTTYYKDYLLIEYGKQCAGNAVGEWYRNSDCGTCNKADLLASWYQKDAMVYAAERYAAINLFAKAEEIARKLETACESC